MTELSQAIFDNYQIRKSRKQKDRFIALMQTHFPEMTVQEGGFPKNKNLILGDVREAEVVLTAHYDTCARLPFPNLITPKNIFIYLLYSIAIIIPYVLLGIGLNILVHLITSNIIINYLISLIFYLIVLYVLFAGPANRHTANDNTSGVITLCEIYQAMTPVQRSKTAIVFFDNEELGILGSGYFRSVYKKEMKQKLLINYDCVSDGDYIMIGISKKARPKYGSNFTESFTATGSKHILLEKAEKLLYPSDQSNFKCTAAVAALNKNKVFGYYMSRIHTGKDTVFDTQNITLLKECTISFIEKL